MTHRHRSTLNFKNFTFMSAGPLSYKKMRVHVTHISDENFDEPITRLLEVGIPELACCYLN